MKLETRNDRIQRVKAIPKQDLYRKLPAVDELLHQPEIAALIEREGR